MNSRSACRKQNNSTITINQNYNQFKKNGKHESSEVETRNLARRKIKDCRLVWLGKKIENTEESEDDRYGRMENA